MDTNPLSNPDMIAKVEQACRQVALENPESRMAKLVEKVDALRAEGKKVEFRVNSRDQSVYAAELEEVSVDLSELGEADVALADEEAA